MGGMERIVQDKMHIHKLLQLFGINKDFNKIKSKPQLLCRALNM